MSAPSSLPEWFKARINAIYSVEDEASRNAALDSFFGSSASVQQNDETLEVQEKRRRIQSTTAASAGTDVKWDNIEETDSVRCQYCALLHRIHLGVQGNLEGQYVLTVSSKFRIRAAPMQRYITVKFTARCALNMRIIHSLISPRVEDDPEASGDDKRRVVSLRETEEIKQAPVHIAQIPRSNDDGAPGQ